MATTKSTSRRSTASKSATKKTASKRASKKSSAKKKASTRKTASKSPRSHANSGGKRKWSAAVDTVSTFPREDLFNQSATVIARDLASKTTSPKGPASGMRMLVFYINRAGKNLSASRLKVLERAKVLLHKKVEEARDAKKSARKGTSK